ncbi:MAG: hypothetical protein [Microviridae sp.]|nr:MAG: hypothetical protein [Microviridae sp.]
MYKPRPQTKTGLKINNSYEGERLEEKIERIVNNKEAITDGAPQIYTERKDGVRPEYDIRTDRFEIAIEAMDKVTGAMRAKREERMKKAEPITQKDGGAEPIQATEAKKAE